MTNSNKITPAQDLLSANLGCFGTILADPPWRFTNRTGKMAPEHRRLCRYPTMSLRDIKEMPIKDLFFSEGASYIRRQIGKYPECKRCTEPGLERYALPYEGFTYLSLLLKMGRKEFLQLHHHLGLDKYLQ